MKNIMINKTHIEGKLYEQTLVEDVFKTGANEGKPYIRGKISVQISEENIITVDIFESKYTKAGAENKKYGTLLQVMQANSILSAGPDAAINIIIDSAFAENAMPRDGEMITYFRNSNGFIKLVNKAVDSKATFEADMLITSTVDEMVKEADGNMMPSGNLILKGWIFDWSKRIIAVNFTVTNKQGVEYFKSLPQNTFTKVWGNMSSIETVSTKIEESAFGESKVIEFVNKKKSYIVTGVNKMPYDFGNPECLTPDEVVTAINNRNLALADRLSKAEEKKKQGTPALDFGIASGVAKSSAAEKSPFGF